MRDASRVKPTVPISSARFAIRGSITGARTMVFNCHMANLNRAAWPGIALAISRRKRRGVSARNTGANTNGKRAYN